MKVQDQKLKFLSFTMRRAVSTSRPGIMPVSPPLRPVSILVRPLLPFDLLLMQLAIQDAVGHSGTELLCTELRQIPFQVIVSGYGAGILSSVFSCPWFADVVSFGS